MTQETRKHNASTQQNTTIDWFRLAAPYIHAHRHATFVIAFDGETIAAPQFDSLIHDFALLSSLGIRLVLVYGARPQIEQQCAQQQISLNYHHGLRITDDASLAVVKSVVGTLRLEIEAKLSFSLPHTPMADARIRCVSGNLVAARPVGIKQGVDLQHTGQVRRIDRTGIEQQLKAGNIVLLPPLGYSPTGEIFNLSAESIATEVAIALVADKLILLGQQATSLPQELTTQQARDLLPKLPEPQQHALHAAIQATQSGVPRVHLLNRNIDGVLLQELFSCDGAGTLITSTPFETTRQATIDDVGGILELIQPLEQKGILMKRSRDLLEMEIDHFTVMERDGRIIACAALYLYPDTQIAELACLAVSSDYRSYGRGKHLLDHIEQHARNSGAKTLCLLTTQTTHWFLEQGFTPAKLTELPIEKQRLYNYQRQSRVLKKLL